MDVADRIAPGARSDLAARQGFHCRFCDRSLTHTFVDLGLAPPSQNHVLPENLDKPEVFLPLRVFVCSSCLLVQLPNHVAPADVFSEYAYFSSYSQSWVDHARRYVHAVHRRFSLDGRSRVVELASNDGYLLQHFVALGVPVLGIEPAANVALVAERDRKVPTLVEFFGESTARRVLAQHGHADLVIANNVVAHVPDLNDFVRGIQVLLAPDGVLTVEVPHLANLVSMNQFDTIYHEHFSYFSFLVLVKVLARHGLRVFDVERVPTHGGSLRVFACHKDAPRQRASESVARLLAEENAEGYGELDRYLGFSEQVNATKRDLLRFLIDAKSQGKRVVGYGAPGKGNTLLNYCGIRTDFLDFTVDLNPYKQGKYTPGTRIPIYSPDAIREARPDFVLILPWNLADEIMGQLSYISEWGGKFVLPIPKVSVASPKIV